MTTYSVRPFEVLFLTDFSDSCFRAIPALAQLGDDVDIRLTILHAHGEAPRSRALETNLNSFFPEADLYKGCRRLLMSGTPIEAVKQMKVEGPIDLIVAPAGDPLSLPRFRSSMRSRLMREPGIPVWTFGGGSPVRRLFRSTGTVVCCVEIGRNGRSQIALASEYARSLDATLHLVHVMPEIDDLSLLLAYADGCDASDLVAAAQRTGDGLRLAPGIRVTDRRRLPELLREWNADIVFLDSQHAVSRQWLGFRMSSFVDQLPCPAVCVDGDRNDIRWRIPSNPTAATSAHRSDVGKWIMRPAAEMETDVSVMLEPVATAS